MDDLSFQSHRNEPLYFTNSQVKFSNYYSYPSSNNTNQSLYIYEPSLNSINTCTESSVVCSNEVYPLNDVLNKNDYQSQENQFNWIQSNNNSHRRRRQRTVFSQSHIQQLDNVFIHNQYPDIDLRETLAAQLGVSESRIQVWFKNRRNRARTAQRQQNKTFE